MSYPTSSVDGSELSVTALTLTIRRLQDNCTRDPWSFNTLSAFLRRQAIMTLINNDSRREFRVSDGCQHPVDGFQTNDSVEPLNVTNVRGRFSIDTNGSRCGGPQDNIPNRGVGCLESKRLPSGVIGDALIRPKIVPWNGTGDMERNLSVMKLCIVLMQKTLMSSAQFALLRDILTEITLSVGRYKLSVDGCTNYPGRVTNYRDGRAKLSSDGTIPILSRFELVMSISDSANIGSHNYPWTCTTLSVDGLPTIRGQGYNIVEVIQTIRGRFHTYTEVKVDGWPISVDVTTVDGAKLIRDGCRNYRVIGCKLSWTLKLWDVRNKYRLCGRFYKTISVECQLSGVQIVLTTTIRRRYTKLSRGMLQISSVTCKFNHNYPVDGYQTTWMQLRDVVQTGTFTNYPWRFKTVYVPTILDVLQTSGGTTIRYDVPNYHVDGLQNIMGGLPTTRGQVTQLSRGTVTKAIVDGSNYLWTVYQLNPWTLQTMSGWLQYYPWHYKLDP
eukprot:gene3960-16501_t